MTLEVGRIGKAHGLRGDVIVHFTTDRTRERTAPGALLFAGERSLSVAKAKPYQKGFLVTFDGVNSREAAEELRGLVLTADPLDADDLDGDVVFVHEVVGKRLVDQDGVEHGEILSVIDNPASDLMELSGDRLVPMVFYVSHDDETVTAELPVGLFDPPDSASQP